MFFLPKSSINGVISSSDDSDDSSSDEEDTRDMEGKIHTAAGVEVNHGWIRYSQLQL